MREIPPPDCSGLVFERWYSDPSFHPSDYAQGTTKIEGLRQACSPSKERKGTSKTTHSQTLFRNLRLRVVSQHMSAVNNEPPNRVSILSYLPHNTSKNVSRNEVGPYWCRRSWSKSRMCLTLWRISCRCVDCYHKNASQ